VPGRIANAAMRGQQHEQQRHVHGIVKSGENHSWMNFCMAGESSVSNG
jgi:hypothetical protein